MILVDFYIPSVDETFDFMLDENTEAAKIIMEICEMISKKIQGQPSGDVADFSLYHINDHKMIEKNRTLYMEGVRDGSRLMLV